MDSIVKKGAQRFLFVKRLYELSDGDPLQYFSFTQIGESLGWENTTTDLVSDYLQREGLVEYPTFGTVAITHKGVKHIERALMSPNQTTDYFPQASIVIMMANGDITVGGDVVARDKTQNSTSE